MRFAFTLNYFNSGGIMKLLKSLMLLTLLSPSLFAGDGGTGSQAGFFGPAAVVRTRVFVLGAEAQYYLNGSKNLGLMGHVRYGLAPRFQLTGDLGLIRGEVYFGANLDYQFVGDQKGGIGVLGRVGGFGNDKGIGNGFKTALLIGNQFDFVNVYGGFEAQFLSGSGNDVLYIPVGIHIPVGRKMAFVGELGANINDKKASYMSGGLMFYF